MKTSTPNVMQHSCKIALISLLLATALLGCGHDDSQTRLDAITIEATGDNFNWYFRYPGDDGVLGTNDDRETVQNLFLPDHAMVTLKLKSKDYLYSFALPDLNLKQIAVPDLDFELRFQTGDKNTLQLLGDQFCGYSHKTLIGKVHIRDQSNGFYDWVSEPLPIQTRTDAAGTPKI